MEDREEGFREDLARAAYGERQADKGGYVGVVREFGRDGEGQRQDEKDCVALQKTVEGGWN